MELGLPCIGERPYKLVLVLEEPQWREDGRRRKEGGSKVEI